MSDTEEGSFDKEAEKEKLREQLRREEEERRSTQHMSELLLKGATMTNRHCDECGDPIFRYQGQEFCPTCTQDGAVEATGVQTPAAEERDAEAGIPAAGGGDGPTRSAGNVDRVETGSGAESRSSAESPTSAGVRTAHSPQRADEVPEDVAAARAALVRKLTTLAQQAEATDDVGRSRELLAAAREAAEALSAIDAVGG